MTVTLQEIKDSKSKNENKLEAIEATVESLKCASAKVDSLASGLNSLATTVRNVELKIDKL